MAHAHVENLLSEFREGHGPIRSVFHALIMNFHLLSPPFIKHVLREIVGIIDEGEECILMTRLLDILALENDNYVDTYDQLSELYDTLVVRINECVC